MALDCMSSRQIRRLILCMFADPTFQLSRFRALDVAGRGGASRVSSSARRRIFVARDREEYFLARAAILQWAEGHWACLLTLRVLSDLLQQRDRQRRAGADQCFAAKHVRALMEPAGIASDRQF